MRQRLLALLLLAACSAHEPIAANAGRSLGWKPWERLTYRIDGYTAGSLYARCPLFRPCVEVWGHQAERARGGIMEGALYTARFFGPDGPRASYQSAPACVSYEGRGVRPVGGFR